MADKYEGQGVPLVRRLFDEVLGKGQLNVADELLTPDFQLLYPFPGFGPGADGLKQFVTTIHDAFADFTVTIESIFESGGKVAVRWTGRGRHTGDFLGIPASNNPVTMLAIGEYQICPPFCGPPTIVTSIVDEGVVAVVMNVAAGVEGEASEEATGMSDTEPLSVPPGISAGWLVMDNLGMLQQMEAVAPHAQLFPKLAGPEA